MTVGVGIDIGGTHLRAAVVDESGRLIVAAKRRIREPAPTTLLAEVEVLLAELSPLPADAPMAVGVAAVMRQPEGRVVVAPNLGWHDVPFGELLSARFGRPVRVVNDLDAITMGEARCGAGRGAENVVCVFVGTGVGMGAVVHGRILEGATGIATEFGHIKVASVRDGRLCGCGERGCLEAYASGRHLPELFVGKINAGLTSSLWQSTGGSPGALQADAIERATLQGDVAAAALWQEIAATLGRAIGNLITLLNPQVLVLGGGVLDSAPSLKRAVTLSVAEYAARPQWADVVVTGSVLGDNAGLVGAGLLAQAPRD